MLFFVDQRAGGHFNGICCNCVRDFHDRSMALEENQKKGAKIVKKKKKKGEKTSGENEVSCKKNKRRCE